MNRHSTPVLALIGATATLAVAANLAVASPSSSATGALGGHATASKKVKHKKPKPKKKPTTGPSLSVIGFGVNRLYVPNKAKVTSSALCDEIVGADGPVGPPQNVYLLAYLRATNIPADAPTRISDSLPEGDGEFADPALSPPAPWSKVFAKGSFAFGSVTGSQKNLFHTLIVGSSAEEGTAEGPSAEEFDGTYSYTTSVEVGKQTLTSTATATVDCPQLR